MPFQSFPFENLFEETDLGRRLIFQSALPQNLPFSQQRGAANLYTPTFNQFLGQIGNDIRSGQTPTTFASFAQNQANLPRQIAGLSDASTPGLTSRTQYGF